MAEPSGLTRFEKDYKVVLEKKTGFVEAGLDVAIRGETAGKAAYLALAESASFADISSFFKFLAGEEELHRRMLEELRSSLEKKGGKGAESARSAPGAVEEKRLLETPKSFSKLLGEADELKKSELKAVLRSMEIEKEFREFYEGMAAKVWNEGARRLFAALAKFEQKHYDLLSELFESVTSTREFTMG